MSVQMDTSLIESGDIVFIRVGNFLYRRVAATTSSWDSHVGIIFKNEDGQLMVAESTIPKSKFTPLNAFLSRSEKGIFAIRRLKGGLSPEQAANLRASAERRMGQPYHFGFRYDSKRQFCSKLVYDVYMEAMGLEVGRLQTFRNLLDENPAAPMIFWHIWFFGFIPWKRRTVTPTSQLRSPIFDTVIDRSQA